MMRHSYLSHKELSFQFKLLRIKSFKSSRNWLRNKSSQTCSRSKSKFYLYISKEVTISFRLGLWKQENITHRSQLIHFEPKSQVKTIKLETPVAYLVFLKVKNLILMTCLKPCIQFEKCWPKKSLIQNSKKLFNSGFLEVFDFSKVKTCSLLEMSLKKWN